MSFDKHFLDWQREFVRPMAGPALVVGSKVYKDRPDRRALYQNAIGADMAAGAGVDVVMDFEMPLPDGFGPFSHVDCCSVLEHVQRPWKMAENIERLLMPGGTLLVAVPFVWRVHAYPSDYWRMTPQALEVIFPAIEWMHSGFIVDSGPAKKVLAEKRPGGRWLERAMTVAFGIRRAD